MCICSVGRRHGTHGMPPEIGLEPSIFASGLTISLSSPSLMYEVTHAPNGALVHTVNRWERGLGRITITTVAVAVAVAWASMGKKQGGNRNPIASGPRSPLVYVFILRVKAPTMIPQGCPPRVAPRMARCFIGEADWEVTAREERNSSPRGAWDVHQEVEVLVALFVRLVATSDARTRTDMNPFWHTGQPRNMNAAGAMRDCRPWDWIWAVASGTSRGWQETKTRTWGRWFRDHITAHMFYQRFVCTLEWPRTRRAQV